MGKVKLNVLGLSYSQTQAGAYALVLSEEDTNRRIPIIIGGFEAQAIAIELEGMKPPRPLTHDLFYKFAKKINVEVREILISKLEEGIFYSDIIFELNGKEHSMDARTSDAVALALRFNCPIYTTDDIISKAGIVLDISQSEEQKSSKNDILITEDEVQDDDYSVLSDEELNELLAKAVEDEDYELASKLRDEINKRE
jgi:bifunctional DNase/RNase